MSEEINEKSPTSEPNLDDDATESQSNLTLLSFMISKTKYLKRKSGRYR